MNFLDQKNFSTTFILLAVISIIGLILWSTSLFYKRLKVDERAKMEIFAQSIKSLNSQDSNDYLDLNLLITNSNNTIPIIVVDQAQTLISNKNIPEEITLDSMKLKDFFNDMKFQNRPLEINLGSQQRQFLYYGSSPILEKLKFYPAVVVLILLLLIGVVYFFFTTTKMSEQNKLWAGMAKETAHQIGTPLSSLVGWTEILKSESVNPEYIVEINKDISRLMMITERFSKIGSIPNLEVLDLVKQTEEAYTYLQKRSSKLIQFTLELPNNEINVRLNQQLFSWTIENVVKNAIDAMRGKGTLEIRLFEEGRFVHINITDSGKGILKSRFNKIFEPGYTSKTRGWGLGLSLAQRIIVDYHMGRIRVLRSEMGKGTTFQITFKKVIPS